MRIILLYAFIIILIIYSWRKDWFIGLCGALVLMAFIEHPDMPKNIAGIQGLNPWNILIFNVIMTWHIQRQKEGLMWDLPRNISFFSIIYMLIMFIGTTRLLFFRGLSTFTTVDIISEFYINSFKWVVVSFLLFDGCRTRKRIKIAIFSIIAIYLLIALQIIKVIPMSIIATSGEDLISKAAIQLTREVGFHRVNLSMMLSGASWAALLILLVTEKWYNKLFIVGLFFIITFGQALTGGRTGYVAWALVGLILGFIRWRIIILIIPLMITLIVAFVPGVKERMLTGMSGGNNSRIDVYAMTSGRTLIWPYVIEKIKQNPIVGYGRQAMQSQGLAYFLVDEFNESFPHPHNAYFEFLLDNGIIGALCIIPFYIMILWYSGRLLLLRENPFCSLIGGITLSLVSAFLIASVGSQTFYPREGSVGMWAAIGIMLRIVVERKKAGITYHFIR